MANGNPFSPRFGAVPPVLGDRRDVLAELAQVAEGNLNSPACARSASPPRPEGA